MVHDDSRPVRVGAADEASDAVFLTRRSFLAYLGGAAAASAAISAVPEVLRVRGWWSAAYAGLPDVVVDTFNGLAAMVWPGNDPYSVAQGEWNDTPGAVAAHTGHHLRRALDGLVAQPYTGLPTPRGTVPLSGSVASAVNSVAVTINPAAVGGSFPSPFARLSLTEKAAVWRTLEQDIRRSPNREPSDSLGALQFVFGVLPALTACFAFSEIDVFDPDSRSLRRRPVGWDHCGYLPGLLQPVEGWDDFRGYYQDRREVGG